MQGNTTPTVTPVLSQAALKFVAQADIAYAVDQMDGDFVPEKIGRVPGLADALKNLDTPLPTLTHDTQQSIARQCVHLFNRLRDVVAVDSLAPLDDIFETLSGVSLIERKKSTSAAVEAKPQPEPQPAVSTTQKSLPQLDRGAEAILTVLAIREHLEMYNSDNGNLGRSTDEVAHDALEDITISMGTLVDDIPQDGHHSAIHAAETCRHLLASGDAGYRVLDNLNQAFHILTGCDLVWLPHEQHYKPEDFKRRYSQPRTK